MKDIITIKNTIGVNLLINFKNDISINDQTFKAMYLDLLIMRIEYLNKYLKSMSTKKSN